MMEYSNGTYIFIEVQFTNIIKEDSYESFSVKTRVYILCLYIYVYICLLFNYSVYIVASLYTDPI